MFAVGGVIKISSRVVISHHVTIAGQTAPGGGITVYGNVSRVERVGVGVVAEYRLGRLVFERSSYDHAVYPLSYGQGR